jgi:hypothetical protein
MWDQETATKPNVDLSRFNDAYHREVEAPVFTPIPDGRYHVEVDDVELGETSTTGNPMLKWTLRISGGDHADRILFKRRVITDKTIRFLKTELKVCGLELTAFSDLPQHLQELKGLHLEVVKKTNGEWVDVYFENRLEGPEDAADDDLPF